MAYHDLVVALAHQNDGSISEAVWGDIYTAADWLGHYNYHL
jgi:hypothetical protein